MNVDKIRNLTGIELEHQQRELSDQLFKMKFQLKMGQTESLKKIREKQIAGGNGASAPKAAASAPTPAAKPAKKAAKVKKTAATEKK